MGNLKERHLKLTNADNYDDPIHRANFERSLENALEANFSEIFDSRYCLLARQYPIYSGDEPIGKIDLLAYNIKTGDLVAIENKKDTGDYDAVGQCCLYMGWLILHHNKVIDEFDVLKDSRKHNDVEGIIICSTPDIRLYYATIAVKAISFYSYGYDPSSGIFGLFKYTKLREGTAPIWKESDSQTDDPIKQIDLPDKPELWSKVAELNAG